MSDGNTNDSESDSKIDYNTKHVYFYLPKVPTEDGEVADNIDLGAMLRLGGYCDLEQQAQNVPSDQQHYYPQKHIESQGAGSENIFKKSAGSSDQSSHGILMACDGHFLLKAAEKMFVETGDHHLQVNGDYEHETTGSVNVQSGDIMSLKSGTNKTLTLNAGDKTGDMELLANNKTETVQGNRTTTTSGDNSDTTSGNDSKITWGFTKKINGGVNWTAFIEGQLVTATWGLQVYGGTLIKFYPLSEVVIAGYRFQGTIKRTNMVGWDAGYFALSTQSHAAKVRTALTQMQNLTLQMNDAAVRVAAQEVQAEQGAVEALQGEVQANIRGIVTFI
ncbi:hypothetical protein J7481_02920 [Labrenzia sp. R4_2]|uniref:hypothetical protein n=1 Tax=Labrenzia sp. R4_2 TaxID=2821107 RepID=UPI001ADCD586|nr:hypothetical protein [Labrenzia sp. R4_2]MBO9418434.1 hypothetical protein [Labrenzia sp. R4_2]